MTDDDLLILAQWFSPAFPVGAFAYSHGLEWLVEAGHVTDADTLAAWLGDVIETGAGRSDVQFLAAGFRAGDADALAEVDALCRAFAGSAERRRETVLQGEAFCETVNTVWGLDLPALAYPVAVGAALRAADLPLGPAAGLYLQAVMASLVGAGMRLIPLGQSEGQAVIRRVTPLCQRVAGEAIDTPLDAVSSTAVLAEIAAMRHETQETRIFRT